MRFTPNTLSQMYQRSTIELKISKARRLKYSLQKHGWHQVATIQLSHPQIHLEKPMKKQMMLQHVSLWFSVLWMVSNNPTSCCVIAINILNRQG